MDYTLSILLIGGLCAAACALLGCFLVLRRMAMMAAILFEQFPTARRARFDPLVGCRRSLDIARRQVIGKRRQLLIAQGEVGHARRAERAIGFS